MNEAQSHRGPDGSGVFVKDGVGFAHVRLAILDLSPLGHQPMEDERKECVLTYNGEIYNFWEIREELAKLGHSFRGGSDTEVILAAYREWGEASFSRFNGIFAFALHDFRRGELYLVRDPVGIKPLFYQRTATRVTFGSEVKAILTQADVSREWDLKALDSYFSFNYCPQPLTGFRDVRQLLPGTYLKFTGRGEMRETRFWNLSFPEKFTESEASGLERFSGAFRKAVLGQTLSDVPVGAFLSAGYDSSAVVKALVETGKTDVSVFNVKFENAIYDESEDAGRVAKSLGIPIQYIGCPSGISADTLFRMSKHLEEPLADSSAIPFYMLCREASKHVKVALSGDGGDETLAGYKTYQATILTQMLKGTAAKPLFPLLRALTHILPVDDDRYSRRDLLSRISRYAGLPFPREHCSWRTIFSDSLKQEVFQPEFLEISRANDPVGMYAAALDELGGETDILNKLLYLDFRFYLPSDLIAKVDRMGMAHGLEVRVPFLDLELLNVTSSLDPELKLKNRKVRKYAIRKYLEEKIPASVLDRPKTGFNAPVVELMRTTGAGLLMELLSQHEAEFSQLLKPAAVRKMVADHRDRRADYRYELYGILSFLLWLHNRRHEWR